MKKRFLSIRLWSGLLLLAILFHACEAPEESPVVDFWKYDGTNSLVKKIIGDLKEQPTASTLSQQFSGGTPLWENSYPLIFGGVHTVMVPVSNKKKDAVRAVIAVTYEEKEVKSQTIFRKDLKESDAFPFQSKSAWYGFFWAMDKEIFNSNDATPGFKRTPLKRQGAADGRYVCLSVIVEICFPSGGGCNGGECVEEEEENCTYAGTLASECWYQDESTGDWNYEAPAPSSEDCETCTPLPNTNVLVNYPDQSKKITNISQYLQCFNLSYPADVMIVMDQPTWNSANAWSGSVGTPNLGHTFISIKQGMNQRVFGFYPTGGVYVNSPVNTGVLVNDSGHPTDLTLIIHATPAQLQAVINKAAQYQEKSYDLFKYNATDFAIAIAGVAGVTLPESDGYYPGGHGSNPGVLGQYLRTTTPPNTTVGLLSAWNSGDGIVGGDISPWPGNLVLNTPAPGTIIPYVSSSYVQCYDTDQDNGILNIYIDEPTPNSTASWSGNPSSPNVGHAFASVHQVVNGVARTLVFGFYPATGVSPASPLNATSALVDDSGRAYDVKITKPLDRVQLQYVLDRAESYYNQPYNFYAYNSTDFILDLAKDAGLNLPDIQGSWPGGYGSNPGNLGQSIRQLVPPTNTTISVIGGIAPSSAGSCN